MPNPQLQQHKRYQRILLVGSLSLLSIGTSRWTLTNTTLPRNLFDSLVNNDFDSQNATAISTTKNTSWKAAAHDTDTMGLSFKSTMPTPINRLHPLETMVVNETVAIETRNDNVNNSNECYSLNSKTWLQGRRIGNVPIPNHWLDPMMQVHTLLHPSIMNAILDQTLCYPTGRFRNVVSSWNASDPQQIRDWQFRLLYMAIHRLFHRPAFDEYQLRRNCFAPNATTAQTSAPSLPPVNNYDYECPKAKFLVVVLNTMGMGATFRNGALPAMYMAVATGRIPLFIQSTKPEDGFPSPLEAPFLLASCDRRDLQCVFMPTSPCVLSWDELRNATVLDKAEARTMKRQGVHINQQHAHARVLLYQANLAPVDPHYQIHHVFHKVAHQAMKDLLQEWKATMTTRRGKKTKVLPEEDQQWHVLTTAVESYRTLNATIWRMRRNLRALQFYLMRPNGMAREDIDKQLLAATALPTRQSLQQQHSGDNNNRQYFGLPIRGSDKCDRESTCLEFPRYMDLMMSKWQQHGTYGKQATILLTTEDTSILPMRLAFSKNKSFPFDFVVNEQDVQPGTGLARKFQEKADAIMISSLTAIKLQLQANVLVGNCCSNFHALLFAFVRDGCAADPNIQFECLDQTEDPRFRICCAWTRTNECNEIRAAFSKQRGGAKRSRIKRSLKTNKTIN